MNKTPAWTWATACIALTAISALGGYNAGKEDARREMRHLESTTALQACVATERLVRVRITGPSELRLEVGKTGKDDWETLGVWRNPAGPQQGFKP